MSQHGHLQEMHVSLAWQDIDTHRATFRKAAEVSQSVPYSREETVSEKLRYIASWFTIPLRKREKDILFFFFSTRLESYWNRSDRVPRIPELSQENIIRVRMKKLSSFSFLLLLLWVGSIWWEGMAKCSMKFILL